MYPGAGSNVGDVLTWDGTKEVWVGPESFIIDRFIGGAQSVSGTNTNANVGQLQWNTVLSAAAGVVSRVASILDHMGIVRIASDAATGRQAIYLGHSAASGNLVALAELDSTFWVARHIANRIRFGFGSDAAALGLGAEAFYVEASTDIDTQWRCVTRSGGVGTEFSTTLAVVPGTFVDWRIQRISDTEYRFFADGVLLYTAVPPAEMPDPAALVGPAFQAIQATGQSIGEIDTFTLQLR